MAAGRRHTDPLTTVGTMRTRWADDVDPALPLPEYPRPQLVRPRWKNLNGIWEAAVHAPDGTPQFNHRVLVPFPVGSELSGFDHALQPDEMVTMRRSFVAPTLEPEERLRLHFGAVDQSCEVRVNGISVGRHVGGFDPFFFDITDALDDAGEQSVEVAVTDPTDTGDLPLGKQTLNPFAIQYTAVAGIWQTVWLEPVPAACIESVVAVTDLASRTVRITCAISGASTDTPVEVVVRGDDAIVGTVTGAVTADRAVLELEFADVRPWSPEDPFLYDLDVRLGPADRVIDEAASYFGAREVGVERDRAGLLRLTLNGDPVFHLGLLDQGWWPDGLYTAPTDEALAFDIEATLAMGFNTIRKHVKVEPARWYWHADRLGVLVWQDMPSTRFDMMAFGAQLGQKIAPPDMPWDEISPGRDPDTYRRELDAMMRALEAFCSIVVWVPFNEAWGQHDTDATLHHVAERDPSRLVDGPSGWVDTGTGDVRDHHIYEGPENFPGTDPKRPVVYGEYGGFKLAVDDHVWADKGWGYATTKSSDELEAAYVDLIETVTELVPRGLAGVIYTQTTDVETEINGLLTYDRAVFKVEPERLREIHTTLLRVADEAAG